MSKINQSKNVYVLYLSQIVSDIKRVKRNVAHQKWHIYPAILVQPAPPPPPPSQTEKAKKIYNLYVTDFFNF